MTSRMRESLFSALEARGLVVDARVLDLFAGSGALAAEALSRGAASAVLVEADRTAASLAEQNLRTIGFEPTSRVHTTDVGSFVTTARLAGTPIDLVFCDPPYATEDSELAVLLDALVRSAALDADATIVVHRRASAPPTPSGWSVQWSRTFGDSLVVLIRRDREDPG